MEAAQVDYLKKAEIPITDDLPKYTWYEPVTTEVVALYTSAKEFPTEVTAENGEVGMVLKSTSFYAESGGQIADTGDIVVGDCTYEGVIDENKEYPFTIIIINIDIIIYVNIQRSWCYQYHKYHYSD